LLRAWGRIELFTAERLAASLALAPSLDEKMVLGEETLRHLQHFELLSTVYGEAGGRRLTRDANHGLDAEPRPRSWSSAGVAQWVLLGASCALSEACVQAHDGLAKRAPRALESVAAELREQFALADAMLRDLLRRDGPHQTTFEADTEHWIRLVLELMNGPTPGPETADAERAFLSTIATTFPSPDVRALFSGMT